MPRGVALIAVLLLAILAGIAATVGLLWPRGSDTARELAVFTGGDPERGKRALARYGCPS
jgi:hypothetical protein